METVYEILKRMFPDRRFFLDKRVRQYSSGEEIEYMITVFRADEIRFQDCSEDLIGLFLKTISFLGR